MPVKRILLAEDDKDDKDLFCEFLNDYDKITIMPVAENGEIVLQYLQSLKKNDLPDAIILDQNMPKRNGLETLKMLKNSPVYSHIPVMIYSTYADGNLTNNSTNLGAALVSSKPVTKEGYWKMIDGLLEILQGL